MGPVGGGGPARLQLTKGPCALSGEDPASPCRGPGSPVQARASTRGAQAPTQPTARGRGAGPQCWGDAGCCLVECPHVHSPRGGLHPSRPLPPVSRILLVLQGSRRPRWTGGHLEAQGLKGRGWGAGLPGGLASPRSTPGSQGTEGLVGTKLSDWTSVTLTGRCACELGADEHR